MNDPPAAPVAAATVILSRHGLSAGAPWECFMVRRHVRSDFAADVFVFPGGKVDLADRAHSVALHACTDGPDPLLPFRLAAIRELFEEAGVLLAYDTDGSMIRFYNSDEDRFSRYRSLLHARDVSLLEMAVREKLRLATGHLSPISRWITPVTMPRRFDTYFFLAIMPTGQSPVHDAIETTESLWISPSQALARSRSGGFPLVFATERHLERLAAHSSPEDVVAATSDADLEPVVPRVVERNGETIFLVPGDPDY